MLKKIVITFFIGTIVFLVGTFLFRDFEFKTANELLEVFGFYQLYAFVLGFSNMYFFDYWNNRTWTKEQRFTRIVGGVFASVIITLIGLFFLRFFTAVIYGGLTTAEFFANESIKNYQFGLWITLTIVSIFHIIYFINLFQKQKLKEQKVIAKTANAQFDALKSQLDPHFLFNSLNVLSSLIHENPDKAEQFTTKLSKVYRYVLEQKNKELVSLQEELQFAKIYMDLLKMRFEDSLVFEIPDTVLNPDSKVVPLSLQLLLENAVKHNVVSEAKPLKIEIIEENDSLTVKNNLQPKKILNKSSGVGLANIVQRYQLLSHRKVRIHSTDLRFIASLPILTKQITIMENTYEINENIAYNKAKKEVQELKGFYANAVTYVVIISGLIFINLKYTPEFYWFFFPMFGWGIGLVFHAIGVMGFGKSWEEKKIKEIMSKENSNTWK